jgi:hypothetical protein
MARRLRVIIYRNWPASQEPGLNDHRPVSERPLACARRVLEGTHLTPEQALMLTQAGVQAGATT